MGTPRQATTRKTPARKAAPKTAPKAAAAPGRPRKAAPARRDPVRSRARILAQATTEFAAKGYDSARMDAIARRCRLSKNMLYHYFGSKEGLFVAVLEQAYEGFRARQAVLSVPLADPEDELRQLIAHTFQALRDMPEVIALLNAENMQRGRHIARSARIRALYDPLLEALRAILGEGVARGIFRDDIDPITLYLSLSSLGYHYLSNQFTLKAAFGIDFSAPTRQAAWLEHVTDMVVGFCRAPAKAKAAARAPRRVAKRAA